jgi:hypothetical protein
MARRFLALTLVLGVVLFLGACEQHRVQEFKAAQAQLATDPHALDGHFRATVTLCRTLSRKSGHPIGAGTEFEMRKKSQVEALVEVADVKPGEVNMFHLVWIKPGEKEVFRRYAEVRVEPSESGYQAVIEWKKADDLHYLRTETQEVETPSFSLSTSLDTSLSREREPGEYSFRVYFNRELLLEQPFTLTGA